MSSLPFNLLNSENGLLDAFNLHQQHISVSMNVNHIGIIQAYNPANQTATVSIAYPKVFQVYNATGANAGNYSQKTIPYPLISGCPVVCLGGGAASLTFPIAVGNECIVMFNDRDLDNWFQGNLNAVPNTTRTHSISDALVIVGIRSTPNVLQGYDSSRGAFNGGTAKVGVSNAGILIENSGTKLSTLLQSILTQLETLSTQCSSITVSGITSGSSSSGPPANAAAIAAVGTALASLAVQLAGVLE